MVQVIVDFDICQAYAVCVGVLPEVFAIQDNGRLHLLDEHPDESLRAKLAEAARLCPMQAISLRD
jgi:ferredoxin